jgi:glutamate-1-semialdehyde 2,1-aminomutase
MGSDAFRDGASRVFVTGSFWFSAAAMAAAVATIRALRAEDAGAVMERAGTAIRDGILGQAAAWDFAVNYTGPVQMPYLTFRGDRGHALVSEFAAAVLRRGAYIHPRHNWFVSAAMTDEDVALVLAATDEAFGEMRKRQKEGPNV